MAATNNSEAQKLGLTNGQSDSSKYSEVIQKEEKERYYNERY